MKRLLLGITGVISSVMFLIMLVTIHYIANTQVSQKMAERWSEKSNVAQISCFFSNRSNVTKEMIEEFEHTMDRALLEASIVSEAENPSARMWVDTYSCDGRITLSNDRTTLDANAIGIGGDFFLFHPMEFLQGSSFSGDDLNHDYCVIDEDAAWKLFGSNDVVGMIVYIGGEPHIITGVVRRPSGRICEASGLDSTIVYVSYETLQRLGRSNGLNHFEIVMPNPVKGFALNLVRERMGIEEEEVEMIENTSRFSLLNRFRILFDFGTRSMNGKAIIYPYWENIARGYEDILAVMTLVMAIFFIYPFILFLIIIRKWWKHKKWKSKDIWIYIKNQIDGFSEKWIQPKRMEFEEKDERKRGGRL